MLEQSKVYGYRIIGALFWEYPVDAIVIPPLRTHKLYVSNWKDLDDIKMKYMRKIFNDHANKYNIPIFDSIKKAVNYLEKK